MGSSSAPDYSGMNQAAVQQQELSKEQMEWFKAEYAATKPERDAAAARANAISDAQLEAMQFATDEARTAAERNRTQFQPLEDRIVADAQDYDTTGRRQQAAQEASADVEQAFGSAQQANNRAIMRTGGTVGGGRAQALMADYAMGKAKATAGATTGAVKNVEQQGYARMMDAAGLGKGVISNQANQQAIATSSGGASAAASNAALAASQSGTGLMQQGYGNAIQGNASAGNLYGQAAGIQGQAMAADNANKTQAASGIASLAGMALMFASDENKKVGTGKKADGAQALEEIESLSVEDGWSYDPSKGGPDDGGVRHTGPMAQDVQAKMGDRVAPSGKAISVVDMNGKLLASMQELSKRVKRIEARVSQ